MSKIIEEMCFSVNIPQKTGITHVPNLISLKSYFPSLDLEIGLLSGKMTFNHQNSTRNSLFRLVK